MSRGLGSIELTGLAPALLIILVLLVFDARGQECAPILPDTAVAQGTQAAPPLPIFETEIVCFALKGRRSWHTLDIYDLGSAISPEGEHLLPLTRVLGALKLPWSEANGYILLEPPGKSARGIDLRAMELSMAEIRRPIVLVEGISDVTQAREVFLPPEVASEFLSMDITWDDAIYGFSARTEEEFAIWEVKKGQSLLAVKTEAITVELPEPNSPAQPRSDALSLDFVQLRGRVNYKPVDTNAEGEVVLDSLEQTFWGGLAGGRYKLTLSEPALTWNNPTDSGLSSDPPYLRLSWGELKYRSDHTETVLGDAVYGLNSLVFPSVKATGVRVNGLLGVNGTAAQNDRSSRGLHDTFINPIVFNGVARVGSEVSLYVNDRLIDSDRVQISLPGQPDTGSYSFEEVSLAAASLNNIRIVIIDPDGIETVIEKNLAGTSSLLPKGALALVGGGGTNRNVADWGARGVFIGGRLLYGLADSLTLGATAGWQQSFFDPVDLDSGDIDERQYPSTSLHGGTQLTWQPFGFSILSGNLAWSGSKDDETSQRFQDVAYKLGADFYPLQGLSLRFSYFRYGPDFFNGGNRNLRDRKGFVVGGKWPLTKKIILRGAHAEIQDNVDKDREQTRIAEAQNLKLSTSLIPRSSLSLDYDRLASNWEDKDKQLYSVGLQTGLIPGWHLSGRYSTGDDLSLGENSNFLDGIRLPGFSLSQSRHTTVTLARSLWRGHGMQFRYWKAGDNERVSAVHTASNIAGSRLQTRTEMGRDINSNTVFFENRIEYPLTKTGGTRLQLQTRYEDDEWRVGIFFNIVEIFNGIKGHFKRIKEERINPDQGAISGRVFVDANANNRLDPGEPGLEKVKVLLGGKRMTYTSSGGYYVFPQPLNADETRISLDPNEVLAIYSCSSGVQGAVLAQGTITEVNLGLTPINTASGYVRCVNNEREQEPLPGVRVFVPNPEGDGRLAESITASDGSYYLEGMRPGDHAIHIDIDTVPDQFRGDASPLPIQISPSAEPQDFNPPDIILSRRQDEDDIFEP